MATQQQGNGMLGGMVPIQLGQGQQQGAYGVQMPLGSLFQPQQSQQMQPVQPTGQQVLNGNAGFSYGTDQLPPAPQQQGFQQQPFMGQQGNFGLTPQWGQAAGQQQGFQQPQQQPSVQSLQQQPAGWNQPQQTFGQPQQTMLPQQVQGGQQGIPQIGLNTRLDGPGIPQALRGRTLGEAITLYSALETDWSRRNGVTQTPAQQSLNQMGAGQQQLGTHQQQGQQGQQPQQVNPWTNPGDFFGRLFEEKLEQRLGPVIQHTQQQAVTQAFTIAKSGISDFGALEGDVMQMLASADPQALANPATWIGAADIVRGRQMREGRYQAQAQNGLQQVQVPGQQNWQGQQQGWQGNPAMMRMQPAGQVPAYGFFTEAPTAPNVSQFGGNGMGSQPSQQDYAAAQKFGMPIQDYMAWKVGVSAQQGPNGQMGQSQQSYFGMAGAR